MGDAMHAGIYGAVRLVAALIVAALSAAPSAAAPPVEVYGA